MAAPGPTDPSHKLLSREAAAVWRRGERGTVVFTNGIFDVLHRGHVALLVAARAEGDRLVDLHLWRLGPGHLGAIVSVATSQVREPRFYRNCLAGFAALSHVTVEIEQI